MESSKTIEVDTEELFDLKERFTAYDPFEKDQDFLQRAITAFIFLSRILEAEKTTLTPALKNLKARLLRAISSTMITLRTKIRTLSKRTKQKRKKRERKFLLPTFYPLRIAVK